MWNVSLRSQSLEKRTGLLRDQAELYKSTIFVFQIKKFSLPSLVEGWYLTPIQPHPNHKPNTNQPQPNNNHTQLSNSTTITRFWFGCFLSEGQSYFEIQFCSWQKKHEIWIYSTDIKNNFLCYFDFLNTSYFLWLLVLWSASLGLKANMVVSICG